MSPEEKESWINALNSAITRAKNRILDEVSGTPRAGPRLCLSVSTLILAEGFRQLEPVIFCFKEKQRGLFMDCTQTEWALLEVWDSLIPAWGLICSADCKAGTRGSVLSRHRGALTQEWFPGASGSLSSHPLLLGDDARGSFAKEL